MSANKKNKNAVKRIETEKKYSKWRESEELSRNEASKPRGGGEARSRPERLQNDQIDHIAIPVKDLKKAINWYTTNFNCTIQYQDETWAYLAFSNINLALVIPKEHPPHVAFVRTDAKKYGTLKTHRDGMRSCYIKDPSSNSIEIMEPY